MGQAIGLGKFLPRALPDRQSRQITRSLLARETARTIAKKNHKKVYLLLEKIPINPQKIAALNGG